jgi:ABC-type transport system substrate-binding protein
MSVNPKNKQRFQNFFLHRSLVRFLLITILAGLWTACGPAVQPAPQVEAPPETAAESAAKETPPTAVPMPAPAEAVAEGDMDAGLMRPEGEPKRGGILRTAFGVTVPHFDIHQGAGAPVLGHMYNGLVRYNLVDGLRTIIPDLATSWEVSEDGLTYTFKLREGVNYHDGEPFSSKDVVASFNRILDPPEGIVIPLQADLAFVDSVEAIDDFTVQFKLADPRPFFLNVLAAPDYVIYSKKSLEENNFDLREVVAPGTGAFRYVEYQTAEKWILERNPEYWDSELPYVDGLELIHVPAWSDRGTAILTEQADMSWNVAFETFQEGEQRAGEIGANRLPNFGAYWVIFNNQKPPFDDPRVRRAVHLAVSKQDLIKAFATQEQINLTRWVPQGDPYATPREEILMLPGYREDKTEDIEEARRLLAEAGYPDGIKDVELLAASIAPHAELLAPAFQDQLKRTLNIEVTIRVAERALLKEEQQNGNFQLVLDTYGHGVSDIAPRANLWWKTGGSQNFSGYSNAEFDALIEQIEVELDTAKRAELIAQAEDVLDQDPPWYLIGYTYHLPMWRSYVKGVDLENRLFAEWGRIETVWLDK